MSFLRLPSESAAAVLPPEIAFLVAEGVEGRLLARAADLARIAGTDAATALLHEGLIAEDAYYRALARALGAPFLDGPIAFGAGLSFPGSLVAGLAPLALGAIAPCVLAPRGPAIAELLAGQSRAGLPAITSPTHLREAVFAAIPERVAAYAAEELRLRTPERAVPHESPSRWLMFLGLVLTAGIGLFSALPPPWRSP